MIPSTSWLCKTFPCSFALRARIGRKKNARSLLLLEHLEDRLTPSLAGATPTFIASPFVPPATPQGGQGSFGGYFAPSDIQTAYGISGLLANGDNGAGETIALIDAFDDPSLVSSTAANFSTSDLHKFDVQFGLPDPPSFKKVAQDGSTNYPAASSKGGWDVEESLDVEWAHAIAPQANLILVEANNNDTTGPNLETAADWAAKSVANGGGGANVVSMSFGVSGGYSGETSTDSTYAPLTFPFVTFLASTDDNGSVNPYTGKDGTNTDPPGTFGQAAYPADSANVVAVGGTSLKVVGNGNFTYSSESVWNNGLIGSFYQATGGGISNFESQPFYQASAVKAFSTTKRTSPDVSFDADPNTGVAVLDSYAGGWFGVGGTSLSAPCWGGLVAIADQIRASAGESSLAGATQALPILYNLYGSASYGSDFHDIKTGNNGTYSALTGYDLATGIGTPIANHMVPDLASVSQMIFTAPAGTNKFILTNNNGVLNLTDNGTLVAFQPTSETSSIVINGGTDNTLTINYSGGTFSASVSFDGGSGFASHTLSFQNGTFTNATYTYTGVRGGSVTLGGQTITFSRVLSIADTDTNASDTFVLASGAVASLLDDGTNNNGISEITSSNYGVVTTTFKNPSTSLAVSTSGGSTLVQLGAMDNGFAPTSETFSGSSGDTFMLKAAAALPASTSVTLSSATTTLDLAGLSSTINGLSGSGTITDSSSTAVTLTVGAGNASGTFAGVIQNGNGTVGLSKTGSGTQSLSGTSNSYTGATTVSAGTLEVDGIIVSNVTVSGTGTLDGTGTVGTLTATAGTVTPGVITGTLTTAAVNLKAGSVFTVGIGGNTTGSYGQDNVASGTITLDTSGAGVVLNLAAFSYTPKNTDTYVILGNGGGSAVSGTFVGGAGIDSSLGGKPLAEGTVLSGNFLGSGLTAVITYQAGSGHDSVAIVVSNATASLAASATTDVPSVPEGGVGNQTVKYTYKVTNTSTAGNEAVTVSAISDKSGSLLSAFETANGGSATIAVGASVTFSVPEPVPTQNAGTTYTNMLSVSGSDNMGNGASASASASIGYTDVTPSSSVSAQTDVASVPEGGVGNQKVKYTYTVSNTSPASTDPITVSAIGDNSGSLLAAFEAANGGSATVAFATAVKFSVTVTVRAKNAGTTYTNTINVKATDDESDAANSSASATISYTDVTPSSSVSAQTDVSSVPEGGVGNQSVKYTYKVTNN